MVSRGADRGASTAVEVAEPPLFRLDARENFPSSNGCDEPSTTGRVNRELQSRKQDERREPQGRHTARIKFGSTLLVLLAVLSLQLLCVIRGACDPVDRPSNPADSATIVLSVALLCGLFVGPLGYLAAAVESRWALMLHACCSLCMSITLFVLMGMAFEGGSISTDRWNSFDARSRTWYTNGKATAESDLKATLSWAGVLSLAGGLLLLVTSLASATVVSRLPGGWCVRIER
jgi:hypothetical protein